MLGRVLLVALVAHPLVAAAWDVAPAHRYGEVRFATTSRAAKIPPVTFDHWLHRARFTCRLCHVDVGFAMVAGQTHVSASTNRSGYHCGACHDGKKRFGGEPLFASCSAGLDLDASPSCQRCHALRDPEKVRKDYEAFAQGLPRTGPARGVHWEEAEMKGLVRPLDFVEGVSIPRRPLRMEKEISIASRGWMTDVIFSHRKHSAWNGCEVCHPDIYPSVQSGERRSSMIEIASGSSCGVCHTKVAFPVGECERCHAKPVR